MKLVLVVDHMAKNDLRPMTDQELKSKYGHKIESLYKACKELNEGLGSQPRITLNLLNAKIKLVVFDVKFD